VANEVSEEVGSEVGNEVCSEVCREVWILSRKNRALQSASGHMEGENSAAIANLTLGTSLCGKGCRPLVSQLAELAEQQQHNAEILEQQRHGQREQSAVQEGRLERVNQGGTSLRHDPISVGFNTTTSSLFSRLTHSLPTLA